MNDINLPPFYVGQRVICIKGFKDSTVELIKDQPYTIAECCFCESCGKWSVGVSEKPCQFVITKKRCHCKVPALLVSGIYWMVFSTRFAPITELFEAISYEKVMETESPLINVN